MKLVRGGRISIIEATESYQNYFKSLEVELRKLYSIAAEARRRGLDPTLEVEVKLTEDMAERIELLVGPRGVANVIRKLKDSMSREKLAFKLAEDVINGVFGKMEPEKAAEQALRTALAVLTEAVTIAPIQGINRVSIKRNSDGTNYLAVYFAGPIRPAGGTEQGLIVVVADYIRKKLGLDRYKPTEDEINRVIEEIRVYEREVRPFQYRVPDEVLRKTLENLPVEVTGVETDPVEVSSYRDLPKVETNRVRGGALIVINDGLIGRHRKIAKIVEELGVDGWEWLSDLWERGEDTDTTLFIDEVIAGRPVFSEPSAYGGFRVRYGRSRNTGLAAVGLHPSTLAVLEGFLAVGTQVKLEKPGKGGIVAVVDSIEPPIVKLRDGSVIRVEKPPTSGLLEEIEEILFLGDILLSFYEFLENKRSLLPANFTEEEWAERVKAKIEELGGFEKTDEIVGVGLDRLKELCLNPLKAVPSVEEAFKISEKLGVPLHPRYTYCWEHISASDVLWLREWFNEASIGERAIKASYNPKFKNLLERIWIPHRVVDGFILIEGYDAEALARSLKLELREHASFNPEFEDGLTAIAKITGIPLRSKAISFVGARMGRPEKAKPREMRPPVHVLFPVSLYGGARRNLLEATSKRTVTVELVNRRCPRCGGMYFWALCPSCRTSTEIVYICPRCGRRYEEDTVCKNCGVEVVGWVSQPLDLKSMVEEAKRRVKIVSLTLLKGVRGLTSRCKIPEPLEKGLLRAKYGVTVFKDGTIRFDSTNAPLTHFKPSEVGVSIKKLRELGYTTDTDGNPLIDEDQICELKVHDVIVSLECAKYLEKVANFIDELLEKFYGLQPYYRVRSYKDLVGHLIVGLAPHTSVGVLGRIIGFTEAKVCFAHPYWHAAKRRDCDGDEDSVMLALDCLINFSKHYLPDKMGGLMDAPLFLTYRIDPTEVDSAVYNLDICSHYPLEFYEATLRTADPRELSGLIDVVASRIASKLQFEGFKYTHPTSRIVSGPVESKYRKLKSMRDKIELQLKIAEKIKCVEASRVAEKILETHLLKDLAGNLKAYVSQSFRCKRCNARYRRVPLKGLCLRCGGELTLTVHPSFVEKYLRFAEKMTEKYQVKPYLKQRVKLLRDEIEALLREKRRGVSRIGVKLHDFMK